MGEEKPSLLSRAYLLITGFDHHSSVTAHLGLQPTSAWNIGDPYETNGISRVHRNAKWMYGGEVFSPKEENEQLDELIEILVPFTDRLANTPLAWQKSLVLVHETDSPNADLALTHSEVAFAFSIKAGFWIDVYSFRNAEPAS